MNNYCCRLCLVTVLVCFFIYAGAAVAAPVAEVDGAGVRIVDQGRAVATIVISERPYASAAYAAEVLNRYLEQATGVQLPVKRTQEVPELSADQTWILLGDSPWVGQAGLSLDPMDYGEFRIVVQDNVVAVVGMDYPEPLGGGESQRPYWDRVVRNWDRDQNPRFRRQRISPDEVVEHYDLSGGTLFGVYRLLHGSLGVRWLWPGELGTVIPRRETWVVPYQEQIEAPALLMRVIRNDRPDRIKQRDQTRTWGEVVVGPDQSEVRYEQDEWWRAQLLGEQRLFRATHAFNHWEERYFEEHPEFFGYQHLGRTHAQPVMAGKHWKICNSEPGVVDIFVATARRQLDADPHKWTVSASQGDSAITGFCMCADCQALDPPGGEEIRLRDGKTGGHFDYRQLTDRHVDWWNRIADQLAETHPGRYVATWAYGAYRFPPLQRKLRDNIIIGFVGFTWLDDYTMEQDRRYWQGWSDAAARLMLRPNNFHVGLGFPLNHSRRMAADIRMAHERGMFAAEFDALIGHWATQGLNYYVLAALLWNPQANVDDLVDDYCAAGFGPAAADIRAYFDELERMTDEVARLQGDRSATDAVIAVRDEEAVEDEVGVIPEIDTQVDMDAAPQWITRRVRPRETHHLIAHVFMEHYDELAARLEAARNRVADHPTYAARIDFLERGLQYGYHEAQVLLHWYTAEPDTLQALLQARDDQLRAIGAGHELNTTKILERHGRYGMNWAFYQREQAYRP